MNVLSLLIAPLLLIAAAQGATDPLASLHLSAAVPSTWQRQPDQGGVLMFADTKVVGDTLLFQSTAATNETLQAAVEEAKRAIGTDTFVVSKPYRICNGSQDGWYLESAPVTGIVARAVVAVTPSRWAVVTYMHLPQFGDPSAAALHALDSTCLM